MLHPLTVLHPLTKVTLSHVMDIRAFELERALDLDPDFLQNGELQPLTFTWLHPRHRATHPHHAPHPYHATMPHTLSRRHRPRARARAWACA